MKKIESPSNSLFKQTKKLLARSGRKKAGAFIIEGERIVRDASNGKADIKYILVSESFGEIDVHDYGNTEAYMISDKLFDELKSTVSSQGILAVASYTQPDTIDFSSGFYLYLDSVSDPGNMGTIIRSAEAFGVDGIILSRGCTDVFSPKVLRSTMSGIFSVKLYFDEGDVLEQLRQNGFSVLGTFPDAVQSARSTDYRGKCVIVMGNEANGICDPTAKLCTHKITIPMSGSTESLNVAVACGIILYEAHICRRGD